MRRTPHIDTAVTNALRDVAVIDAALVGLAFARDLITQRGRTENPPATAEASAMFADLYRRKSEALHRAMQFGALTTNDELRRKAFQAAAGYLAQQRMSIMQYLSVDGSSPTRIDSQLEDEFRAEIVAAVAALSDQDGEVDQEGKD